MNENKTSKMRGQYDGTDISVLIPGDFKSVEDIEVEVYVRYQAPFTSPWGALGPKAWSNNKINNINIVIHVPPNVQKSSDVSISRYG